MSRRSWQRARWLVFLVGALAIAATVAWFVHTPAAPGVPPALVPPQWAEFRTSLGHEAHVGAKDVTCKDCHSYEDGGFRAPPADICGKCHADQTMHGHGGGDAKATACLDCHPFAPRKTMPTCIGCHTTAQLDHRAIGTHATADCRACHTPHGTPATTAKECSACHEERAPNHAAHDGSKGCADCHAPHQPAAAAKAACATCHAQAARPHPEAHTCGGCHQTHELRTSAAVCTTCHAGKPTLGARAGGPKEHATCTSCHDAHSPMSDPKASCAKCHSDVAVKHGGGGDCVACHAPHRAGGPAQAAVHGAKTNALAMVPRAAACTSCHSKVAIGDVAHAAGTPCTKCHQQHAFSPPADRLAPCATCHARETGLAAAGMAGLTSAPRPPGQGHRGCTSCHGADAAHAPQAAPACATCHQPEATSAPAGHAKCQGCHEPHSGKLAGTIQATCTSCHAPEAGTAHGKAPGGCVTCHRAHGPNGVAAPPTCTTCHAKPGSPLPGLHAEPKHGACASCHEAHGPPKADRATCTSCHQDRVNHQPTAPVCNGCHVFR